MIIEFSIENFRSIKERTTLSLVAARLQDSDSQVDHDNIIRINEKLSLLRSAVIYGANASGKTNLFKAFGFMHGFVGNSAREGQADDAIGTEPFCLNPSTASSPSVFEAVFLLDGIQYRYGFSVNEERVISEWLYYLPTTREVELFTRDKEGIHVRSRFREGRGLEPRTRTNALFLSVVAQFNGEIATRVRRWFTQTCQSLTTADDFGYLPYTMHCIEQNKYHRQIEELVRRLDLDIIELSVGEALVPEGLAEIHDLLAQKLVAVGDQKTTVSIEGASSRRTAKELRARHFIRDDDEKIIGTADFPIQKMESEGTQKLIALAGPLIDTLTCGNVLFVDEIDARLHPLLTAAFVRLFNSPETNPKNAQLRCATYDTNLLDRRYFRRDQIYFVEKDRTSATHLYSLSDFKLEVSPGGEKTAHSNASFERNYIQGRYGAIPYIGDLYRLFVEELQQKDDGLAGERLEVPKQ